ncbi:hypothetical protein SmJEL517_g00875 [Synchytrium microbalum]|uniref:Ubiquitin-like-conjugating enzyme ATG10 n=1 Tax=Synchytrium microbalum TaxID=1806994 RepID=A0A507CCK4_9FUNG|nr:uncharacterized protein SmJEL517_g00875 [Synchytrium microbalum]TPX36909.1 hypothetical protein SmJEL517_g00875 [Synchytrium microbalum]
MVISFDVPQFLTRDEFKIQALGLVRRAEVLREPWTWTDIGKGGYLVKNVLIPDARKPSDEALDSHNLTDEEEDPAALNTRSLTSCSKWQFHVCYSPSWRSPVLYFIKDGPSYNPLHIMLDIEERLSGSDVGRFAKVSQQDHPHLNIPFFYLHPCGTSQHMGDVAPVGEQYLLTWLSCMSHLFPLVDLEYYVV